MDLEQGIAGEHLRAPACIETGLARDRETSTDWSDSRGCTPPRRSRRRARRRHSDRPRWRGSRGRGPLGCDGTRPRRWCAVAAGEARPRPSSPAHALALRPGVECRPRQLERLAQQRHRGRPRDGLAPQRFDLTGTVGRPSRSTSSAASSRHFWMGSFVTTRSSWSAFSRVRPRAASCRLPRRSASRHAGERVLAPALGRRRVHAEPTRELVDGCLASHPFGHRLVALLHRPAPGASAHVGVVLGLGTASKRAPGWRATPPGHGLCGGLLTDVSSLPEPGDFQLA